MTINKLIKELKELGNEDYKQILQNFFKTGKGQYGEGDIFLGIKVPILRKTAKEYFDLSLKDIQKLIDSKIHEHRLIALFVLIKKYETTENKKEIFNFYLKNAKQVNNWDLVDLSAPNIVGNYLLDKERSILYKLAKSDNLWEKRISILATFAFIKNGESKDILKISRIMLNDDHDLIHKATGWMLRELGKKVSQAEEEKFLKKYYKVMPRTMLRYSIERFNEKKRQYYMKK